MVASPHTTLIHNIMSLMYSKYGNERVRLFRRESGLLRRADRYIRVNLKGGADIDGFVMVGDDSWRRIPMYICIEAKVTPDKLNKDQKIRKREFNELGVIYHIVEDTRFHEDMENLFEYIEHKERLYGDPEAK